MALAARPSSLPAGASIPSGQLPSGGRNIATIGHARIDELTPQAEVQADVNYNFTGFSDWMQHRRPPAPEPLRNMGGDFALESATFLSLLGQYQAESDVAQPEGAAKRAFQSLLSKAIRAYEGTASVIHHTRAPRGGSLSLSL